MSKKINIDTLSKNIILELLSYKYNKTDKFNRGRPSKCTKEYYLDKMFFVLKEGIGWNYIDDHIIKGDTIRKMFTKWAKDDIFKDAWIIILNIYSFMKLDFEDIFIDASHIKNVLGSEMIGPNHYDRYRPGTKLSIICDDIGIPISIKINKSNVHDSKFIEDNLEEIPIDVTSSKYLIGDKGYIGNTIHNEINKKYLLKMVTPKRKNQKDKISKKYEKKLGQRFIIEVAFGWFKKFKRLRNRYDKSICTFESFTYFGALSIISNKILKITKCI